MSCEEPLQDSLDLMDRTQGQGAAELVMVESFCEPLSFPRDICSVGSEARQEPPETSMLQLKLLWHISDVRK